MATSPDRLESLLAQNNITGIDFVYVYPDQVHLDVYFLNDPQTLAVPLGNTLAAGQIRIYSPFSVTPDIPLSAPFAWAMVGTRNVLKLTVAQPGDFSIYRFHIDNPVVDPFYNDVNFSFKANCPSDLDCLPPARECPADEPVDFPVDYTARDYNSFVQTLTDFAAQRYPGWLDRLEADAGMMMTEVMSALGDEMAYYQDRLSRESYLETAMRRRSVRRMAALVDYPLQDGMGAAGWLDIDMAPGQNANIPAGIHAWAQGSSGLKIHFETGKGLTDSKLYNVDAVRNVFTPHIMDKSAVCLLAGSTQLYLSGFHTADIPFDDLPADGPPGKWVLLKTTPGNPAQPIRTQLVRVIASVDMQDFVLGQNMTLITWEQPLSFDFDLTQMVIRCNQIPVTAGVTNTAYFVVGAALTDLPAPQQTSLLQLYTGSDPGSIRAIERTGRDGTIIYRFALPGSNANSLVYFDEPEIRLTQVSFNGTCWQPVLDWINQPSFIGANASGPEDPDYILEDGYWKRLVGYQLIGREYVHYDYDDDPGVTIRFGDGQFGLLPAPGTVFRVDYRLGNGSQGNVATGAIQNLLDDRPHGGPCDSPLVNINYNWVSNPLALEGGADAQTLDQVRQQAPQAYQAVTYRAVRPEDYAEAAERLPWVQQAGAAFRWTGSWLSVFVTPDPLANSQRWSDTWSSPLVRIDSKGQGELQPAQREDLEQQLDRFRQAGREAWVLDPVYANIDMKIEVCALPDSYPGDVETRVLARLFGAAGYFNDNNFTFGTLLERSTLEAAIQQIPGVRAVEGIEYRRRGWFDWKAFNDLVYDPGKDSIIRIENDPNHPEEGVLSLHIHGGA